MRGPTVRARKQRVLAGQSQRADRPLDHIGVDLDATIVEEQRQTRPAAQGITDGVSELALLADESELLAQPRLKCLDERPTAVLAHSATLLGRATADLALDLVESPDPHQRFRRDRRRRGEPHRDHRRRVGLDHAAKDRISLCS